MAERQGIYISQLPESTSLTDNMLFATDNGVDNNSVSVANLAEYVNNKIDVAGQVNNGVSEANSYADTKKTEAVNEVKEWSKEAFSNPNLLINGDFQVWQRGESFSTKGFTERYTADRWKVVSTDGSKTVTIKKAKNGAEFYADADGSSIIFRYRMEEKDLAKIRGKKCTLSYSINNIVTIKQHTVSSTLTENNILFEVSATIGTVHKVINWVKLELGEVATPFVPRPYAEELLLCQRYYQKLNSGGSLYYTVGSDVGRGSTTCYVQKSLSTIMRSIPTVTINGSWRATTGSSHVVVNSIASDASTNTDILSIRCTLASTISSGSIFVLQGSNDKNANIELDAEIY